MNEDLEGEVEVHAGLDALADEWEGLARSTGVLPSLWPGWVEAWWEAFGSGGALTTVGVRARDGRLTAVVALVRRRGRLVAPVNWHAPVYGAVVETPAAAAALVGAVLDRSPAVLDLAFLDRDAVGGDAWEAASHARGRRVVTRELGHSPYIALEGDFAAWEAGLEGHFRRETRRHMRRLAEQGEVAFEVTSGGGDLDARLDEIFAVEAAGWKGQAGTAIVSRPDTHRFYRTIARWAAARDLLRLCVLRLDGRAIAFVMCLEDGRRTASLKWSHLPEYSRDAAGRLVVRACVERAYELGLETFELLGVSDDYKRRLTSRYRTLWQVQSFGRGPAGTAAWSAFAHGRPAAKRAAARAVAARQRLRGAASSSS